MTEEQKKREFKTTMGLTEFAEKLLALNNHGRDLTLKHKEKWGVGKEDAKNLKGGKRYHAPATDSKCPLCNQIIKAHDEYMELQASQIGMTGIPFESLMSAIKITRATILMMKNEGELK